MNKEFVGIFVYPGKWYAWTWTHGIRPRNDYSDKKNIPESGYLPTCSDRKPLKKYLGKSTDSESESDLQMILKVVALLLWSLEPSWYNRPMAVWCHNCASQPLKKRSNNRRRLCSFWWSTGSSCKLKMIPKNLRTEKLVHYLCIMCGICGTLAAKQMTQWHCFVLWSHTATKEMASLETISRRKCFAMSEEVP